MRDEFTNFYARWRAEQGPSPRLREEAAVPPESLLQTVWFHQRLLRDQLMTIDGRRLQVLHPGFWNREAGPDFRDAVVQFDGQPPRVGDVEVDLHSRGWHEHGHDQNPAFGRVLLHVVWQGSARHPVPTLPMQSLLDAPLAELSLWLGSETARGFPAELTGKCCSPMRGLPAARVTELLDQAACVRLHSKASAFRARARQAGWDQALWEGLFRALGYKHNTWPMQRLAELRERLAPSRNQPSLLALQARLLGTAGLLPEELSRAHRSADEYARQLWDAWWRERDAFADCALPRTLWRCHGLRPANHPQRRLALAAHWLVQADLPARLQQWLTRAPAGAGVEVTLLELLQVPEDAYWTRHWTLRSRRMDKPQPLLGMMRATDLAMNVFLPWLLARAAEAPALHQEIERRYLAWPQGEDNAVLRLARLRLLGVASAKELRRAATQQGLLQIVRDFCEHSNAVCQDCRFPELVRQWLAAASE